MTINTKYNLGDLFFIAGAGSVKYPGVLVIYEIESTIRQGADVHPKKVIYHLTDVESPNVTNPHRMTEEDIEQRLADGNLFRSIEAWEKNLLSIIEVNKEMFYAIQKKHHKTRLDKILNGDNPEDSTN
jgi:hypothetical protein